MGGRQRQPDADAPQTGSSNPAINAEWRASSSALGVKMRAGRILLLADATA
jgi:hypothetical protein